MTQNLKHLRIVDITEYHLIKTKLGTLSSHLEYKIKNPASPRQVITNEEVFKELRNIIILVENL